MARDSGAMGKERSALVLLRATGESPHGEPLAMAAESVPLFPGAFGSGGRPRWSIPLDYRQHRFSLGRTKSPTYGCSADNLARGWAYSVLTPQSYYPIVPFRQLVSMGAGHTVRDDMMFARP